MLTTVQMPEDKAYIERFTRSLTRGLKSVYLFLTVKIQTGFKSLFPQK